MKKFRILVVDDENFLLNMYKQKLQLENFEPVLAKDGEEAINLLKTASTLPDAVLLDYMLPKKDGIEVLKEIKADPNLKNIPVVMLTNNSSPEVTDAALQAGADSYLIKSDKTPNEVVQHLNKILTTP